MAFTVYRLAFADPLQFYEQLGDPVTTEGGAAVPALRASLRHSVSLATFPPNQNEETTALRLRLRRQWRSLANNTPMKLAGLYLAWDVDPEQNGWYLPDQGQLVDIDGSVGLATGVFKVENFVWILAGRPRTHRRAMWIYLKDLRTGLWARDYRRLIYSTDFANLLTLGLSYFPPGASDLITTSSGKVIPVLGELAAGSDGAQCIVGEAVDLARVSYEQAEGDINKGQVIVYDRRGEANGPIRGPGERWEEFYGIDYPYSWLGTDPEPMDTPVLENGRCRVRYDATHTPGWRIDVWTSGGWEEQGKVCIKRREREDSIEENYDTELLSASLVEYSETRAVILAVMKTPANPWSREEVFITLQRGWSGPRFEVYPAPGVFSTTEVDAFILFTLAKGDTDNSVIKLDASENAIEATAMGTGHTGLWPTESPTGENLPVGAESFTGENFVVVGRWGRPYGITAAVVQAEAYAEVFASTAAYGTASTPVEHNTLQIQSRYDLKYMSVHFGFPEQVSLQALEAENMTLGAGTSITADAAASAGHATTAVRTTDANAHITQPAWPGGPYGSGTSYLVFARVKTSAATLHIYASAYTTGPTKTTTSTSYVWVCLGEVNVNNTALAIHCWCTEPAPVFVDRIEAFLLQDGNSIFEGGRDRGQASLVDSRTIPTLVAR